MNSSIRLAGKHLLEFVKQLIRPWYKKWNLRVVWDKELIKDLMEYFNLSYDETKCMLKMGNHMLLLAEHKRN